VSIAPYYETKLCLCGCGQIVNPGNKFISGHNSRTRKLSKTHRLKIGIAQKNAWATKREKPSITFHGKICRNCKNIFFIKSANKKGLFCSYSCFQKYWSITHQGKNNHMYGVCGESAPNWRGGLSFEPYPSEFNSTLKAEIRKLYKNRCVLCGKKQSKRKHDVHHIDYDKENFDCINLVPLCAVCHRKTNFHRKQWMEYFKNNEPKRLRIL